MEVSGQLKAPADLSPGKISSTLWLEGWVGPKKKKRPGRFGEEKKSLAPAGIVQPVS